MEQSGETKRTMTRRAETSIGETQAKRRSGEGEQRLLGGGTFACGVGVAGDSARRTARGERERERGGTFRETSCSNEIIFFERAQARRAHEAGSAACADRPLLSAANIEQTTMNGACMNCRRGRKGMGRDHNREERSVAFVEGSEGPVCWLAIAENGMAGLACVETRGKKKGYASKACYGLGRGRVVR